jgi:hypothetical protein
MPSYSYRSQLPDQRGSVGNKQYTKGNVLQRTGRFFTGKDKYGNTQKNKNLRNVANVSKAVGIAAATVATAGAAGAVLGGAAAAGAGAAGAGAAGIGTAASTGGLVSGMGAGAAASIAPGVVGTTTAAGIGTTTSALASGLGSTATGVGVDAATKATPSALQSATQSGVQEVGSIGATPAQSLPTLPSKSGGELGLDMIPEDAMIKPDYATGIKDTAKGYKARSKFGQGTQDFVRGMFDKEGGVGERYGQSVLNKDSGQSFMDFNKQFYSENKDLLHKEMSEKGLKLFQASLKENANDELPSSSVRSTPNRGSGRVIYARKGAKMPKDPPNEKREAGIVNRLIQDTIPGDTILEKTLEEPVEKFYEDMDKEDLQTLQSNPHYTKLKSWINNNPDLVNKYMGKLGVDLGDRRIIKKLELKKAMEVIPQLRKEMGLEKDDVLNMAKDAGIGVIKRGALSLMLDKGGKIPNSSPSHEEGGVEVRQGGKQVAEVEGGERFFSADSTEKMERLAAKGDYSALGKLAADQMKIQDANTSTVGETGLKVEDDDYYGIMTQNLLDTIGKGESDSVGGYNAIVHLRKPEGDPTLSGMTITEARKKHGNKAIGRYQIIGSTMKGLIDKLDIDPDTYVLTPENQDELGKALLEGRGLNKFIEGDPNFGVKEFMHELSKEWAALPKDPSGDSYYEGDKSGNTSHISYNEMHGILSGGTPEEREAEIAGRLKGDALASYEKYKKYQTTGNRYSDPRLQKLDESLKWAQKGGESELTPDIKRIKRQIDNISSATQSLDDIPWYKKDPSGKYGGELKIDATKVRIDPKFKEYINIDENGKVTVKGLNALYHDKVLELSKKEKDWADKIDKRTSADIAGAKDAIGELLEKKEIDDATFNRMLDEVEKYEGSINEYVSDKREKEFTLRSASEGLTYEEFAEKKFLKGQGGVHEFRPEYTGVEGKEWKAGIRLKKDTWTNEEMKADYDAYKQKLSEGLASEQHGVSGSDPTFWERRDAAEQGASTEFTNIDFGQEFGTDDPVLTDPNYTRKEDIASGQKVITDEASTVAAEERSKQRASIAKKDFSGIDEVSDDAKEKSNGMADYMSQEQVEDIFKKEEEDAEKTGLAGVFDTLGGMDRVAQLTGMAAAYKSATAPLPQQTKSEAWNRHMDVIKARQNYGLSAEAKSLYQRQSERTYHMQVRQVGQYATSGQAALGAMGAAAVSKYDQDLKLGLADEQARERHLADYGSALARDESMTQTMWERNVYDPAARDRDLKAGLIGQAVKNVRDDAQFEKEYGKGSAYSRLYNSKIDAYENAIVTGKMAQANTLREAGALDEEGYNTAIASIHGKEYTPKKSSVASSMDVSKMR